jgi:hypothetical protein
VKRCLGPPGEFFYSVFNIFINFYLQLHDEGGRQHQRHHPTSPLLPPFLTTTLSTRTNPEIMNRLQRPRKRASAHERRPNDSFVVWHPHHHSVNNPAKHKRAATPTKTGPALTKMAQTTFSSFGPFVFFFSTTWVRLFSVGTCTMK